MLDMGLEDRLDEFVTNLLVGQRKSENSEYNDGNICYATCQ